jgi:hypothetical protein
MPRIISINPITTPHPPIVFHINSFILADLYSNCTLKGSPNTQASAGEIWPYFMPKEVCISTF